MNITRRQAQFLKNFLADYIDAMEEAKLLLKEEASVLYDLSDPDDSGTKNHFDQLNAHRDAIRYCKKQQNKLSEIQREVKIFLSK
jgi:hypothetical protein